jgi:hypothetical protein
LFVFNLQATKDSRFNAELRKAACCSSDRRNLFYRVKGADFPSEWIEALEKREEDAAGDPFDRIEF